MSSPEHQPAELVASDPAPDVIVLNRDLFFGIRLRQVLLDAKWHVRLVPNSAAVVRELRQHPDGVRLVLVDLAAEPDWILLARAAGRRTPPVPILAFGSHTNVEGFREARRSGATRVVSNGDFHRDMLGLIERYALPRRNHQEA